MGLPHMLFGIKVVIFGYRNGKREIIFGYRNRSREIEFSVTNLKLKPQLKHNKLECLRILLYMYSVMS